MKTHTRPPQAAGLVERLIARRAFTPTAAGPGGAGSLGMTGFRHFRMTGSAFLAGEGPPPCPSIPPRLERNRLSWTQSNSAQISLRIGSGPFFGFRSIRPEAKMV